MSYIQIKGAREHNLKNISVDIPKNELTVITGLSGSGKSSLAFDTLYAEGQRRYVESLSAYARQFLDLQKKPDADVIEGLSPAISIEQKTTSKNPRSTVGTITEIYDYMRLLWARIGIPYSPVTGKPIESLTVSQMVDRIMPRKKERVYVLAPFVQARKGEYKKELKEFQKKGFARAKIDGKFYELEDTPDLKKNFKHDIDIVVDRLEIKEGIESRLASSIETALRLSNGLLVIENADTKERTVLSENFTDPESDFTIPELEPRLFSFNAPYGACPVCEGLGVKMRIDPNLVIPDQNLSLSEGAISPWSKSFAPMYMQTLESLSDYYGVSIKKPFKDLSEDFRRIVLYGTDDKIKMEYKGENSSFKVTKSFEGVIPSLERRLRETDSEWTREELGRYQSSSVCEACHGRRLKPEALAVKIAGKSIVDIAEFSIRDAAKFFKELPKQLTDKQNEIAIRVLKEINERLSFLLNVGLAYLTLDRMAGTLSGGESQRIRLASQIGSGLTGVLYVLDEPSIGLHQSDNDKLLLTLKKLKELGNTVIVVEHDEDAIRTADFVIDMGPAAGANGGYIVAQGTPQEIEKNPNSVTGQYLSGKKSIPVPKKRRKGNGHKIILKGANLHNLKNLNAEFPLGVLTAVTGVSGSGKSSLVIETLYDALEKILNNKFDKTLNVKKIEGTSFVDKVIDIDQSPIGRTPRSNPATYIGAFTPIREFFAGLPEAKARGYGAGRFSFNIKGGRCEACQGDGVIKIEMNFLPDVYVTCDVCKGKRYNPETLAVTYKGKTISDVLDMTVDEAAEFFKAIPSVRDKLTVLQQVGMGYIKVGQQATTLSGGEAQRVKLSKELSKRATGKTIYILDEPTTGLHFDDVKKLLEVLHLLVEQGNTVIVIEHNLDVIKTADYVIDIGPHGGDEGGQIVAKGAPEDIVKAKESLTGQYLKRML